MNKCYLYCDPRSLNNATEYYINVVKECLYEKGYTVFVVHHLKDIYHPDVIFVVTAAYYTKDRIKYPRTKIISWMQGCVYEEAKTNRPYWSRIIHYFMERWCVMSSEMLLLTSGGMLEYYQQKMDYHKGNYVIMPCFNMEHGEKPSLAKYAMPTFVYAGSTAAWQCFDVMLDVYSLIEKSIPYSMLYLYCKKDDAALSKIKNRGIKNVAFDYVSVDELQKHMLNYKYGVLLRERSWINYVATPTKMNSYLASYVIPIFSNSVEDFNSNIKLGEFTLNSSTPLDPVKIASMVVDFEKGCHNYEKFQKNVDEIFETHYNTEKYKQRITAMINDIIAL